MTLKNWTVWARWYSSGSFVKDTPVASFWTRRGALKGMNDYMLECEPFINPEGRNSLILTDNTTKQELEVYRW